MKFDELDKRMRVFETTNDAYVLPGIFMVARLDGRSFTHFAREVHHFEAPYDIKFRDYMVATMEYLIADSGFQITYGYTQSDEISLLFHREENTFNRKIRKYNSILAGECSAKFSLLINDQACFDCRISQLPDEEDVVDYFRWRSEDAHRNALNSHCYWKLRSEGVDSRDATMLLSGMSIAAKNEFLFQHGINFNDLPAWQKRGIGINWTIYEKEAWNPKMQSSVLAQRRKLKIDYDLPLGDDYGGFIKRLLRNNSESMET
jgi:tRNA(His) guanylyltransferase